MRCGGIRGSARVLLALFVLCPAFFLTAVPARGADNPVTLNADLTLTETRVIDTDTVYDLNGHTISLAENVVGGVFRVNSGATLTINDSSASHSGKITGGRAQGYDGSYGGSGESALDDSLSQGGGVFVADGGALVLNGGTITGNRAVQGGGVFLNAGASLSVSGFASVTGNFSVGSDGQDGAADNVWLPLDASDKQSVITVSGSLDSGAVIGVTTALDVGNKRLAVTDGLNGRGNAGNFASDAGFGVTRNDDGEAALVNLSVNFTVTVKENYVTGWTLVTAPKTDENSAVPVYKYDGNAMYYVQAYGAYAYLAEGGVTEDAAKAHVTPGTESAATIAANSYDVNHTGKVDYSDTLLTYRCYVLAHQTPSTAMEAYLRADVDGSKTVDTLDVSAIDRNRVSQN